MTISKALANHAVDELLQLGYAVDGDKLTPPEKLSDFACKFFGVWTDPQLLKFYGVVTATELISAQAQHIERLQAKLPAAPSFGPARARES